MMADYIVPAMLLSWLLGLLFGFNYGLHSEWFSMIIYLYCMIIVTIVFIVGEFRNSLLSRKVSK